MNKPRNVVMVKFKIFEWEEVLDVAQITGDEVIHSNHMKPFLDEPVTKMRS